MDGVAYSGGSSLHWPLPSPVLATLLHVRSTDASQLRPQVCQHTGNLRVSGKLRRRDIFISEIAEMLKVYITKFWSHS